jgi:hypothetical protein
MTNYGIKDEDLNPQGIFTKVASHLLTQKVRCVEGISCALRGPNGTACAVGCLLTDDELPDDMSEGAFATAQRVQKFSPFDTLLDQLQFVHDHTTPEDWPVRLADLAADYDLAMPEVTL